eukprot:TRINITY_DN3025_c0_g1_i1.p1 TRINITY_DN3025_c0_g1~~TRINITY_DN3025_c0_g1_i1.p1  ORF type:complete len:101 (+),score=11.07 TRINITY_DN3025_c0_g1_i1:238-540(+)
MELTDIRREYLKSGLRRDDLQADPIDQFNLWLEQAVEAKLTDPTAMTVATVDENGMPFQRIVLLKNVDKDGFVFTPIWVAVRHNSWSTMRISVCTSRGTR